MSCSKWSYFLYVIIKEEQILQIIVLMKHFPFMAE